MRPRGAREIVASISVTPSGCIPVVVGEPRVAPGANVRQPSGLKHAEIGLFLTIADLLAGTARAEHPDDEPDLNFKKAKAESHVEQAELL